MVLTIYDFVKAHGGTITVNSFNSPPCGSISFISNYSEPGTTVLNTFNSPLGGPPGGEMKVETATAKEGEGSTFSISLPQ